MTTGWDWKGPTARPFYRRKDRRRAERAEDRSEIEWTSGRGLPDCRLPSWFPLERRDLTHKSNSASRAQD